ncbi:20413_t:CDS:2 [Gigaspora margarita]|uniref:20413_t:CDS:1 n=1 Tax=Gigaspora margarita TaxID=4874 RepID=A0ABN7UGD3_GIGMA|nr:20413_t:CDS:2 [Gigaspora margarita]
MDNELQISKLTELLEYLHKNNTNKDDIVESESISKSAGLKYINLAEVLGLDHSIILEYQVFSYYIQKTWKDQDINAIANVIKLFKNKNAKFSKGEHDWAIKQNNSFEENNIEKNYSAEDNDERNDDIEENYSAKDDDERMMILIKKHIKEKYFDNNTDSNKEHPQVNKISKKKYQYEDIDLNDESLQVNKASKKSNLRQNKNNALCSSIIENVQDSNSSKISTLSKNNASNKTHNLRSHCQKSMKIKSVNY